MATKKATSNGSSTKESKESILKRLASKRVTKAIKAIRLVGNLSSYSPNDAQKKAIVDVLAKEVNAVNSRLASTVSHAEEEFSL